MTTCRCGRCDRPSIKALTGGSGRAEARSPAAPAPTARGSQAKDGLQPQRRGCASGDYVADVGGDRVGCQEEVLETKMEGPISLAKLPRARAIKATYGPSLRPGPNVPAQGPAR
jgi:hypothetical protein